MDERARDQLLAKLCTRAKTSFGDDLRSIVLYGSAAQPSEHDADFSDINVLCVVRAIDPALLSRAQSFFEWCASERMPAPLLLCEGEIEDASRCFAIEFRDLQWRRRVLFGPDLFSAIRVDEATYRAQVEYELRAKLFRLRQRIAAVFTDKGLLCRLLLDSVTTFCVLIRHALLADGVDAASEGQLDRHRILTLAQEHFGIRPDTFQRLLDARRNKSKPSAICTSDLIGDYLKQIEFVTNATARRAGSASSAGAIGEA
jgi:predicted nucleotidyltransferase